MINGNGHPTREEIQRGIQPNVNLELTKDIRNLLAAAERGQIGSIIVVGADTAGNLIKMAAIMDGHLFTLYTGCGLMQDKCKERLAQLEQPTKPQSAILPAKNMPGEI